MINGKTPLATNKERYVNNQFYYQLKGATEGTVVSHIIKIFEPHKDTANEAYGHAAYKALIAWMEEPKRLSLMADAIDVKVRALYTMGKPNNTSMKEYINRVELLTTEYNTIDTEGGYRKRELFNTFRDGIHDPSFAGILRDAWRLRWTLSTLQEDINAELIARDREHQKEEIHEITRQRLETPTVPDIPKMPTSTQPTYELR